MIYLGIDPDIAENGVACWDTVEKNFIYIKKLNFWDVVETFKSEGKFTAIIEAGWLIKKSNWHSGKNDSKGVGEIIAKSVGRNHQVGILLYEYCVRNDIKVKLVTPKGKVKKDYFKKLTGWSGRVNQDMIDASMLVYGL